MAFFGGIGGVKGGRPIDPTDLFEVAVNRALGEVIRTDIAVAAELWSALANVTWSNGAGDQAVYSFRAAGDMIAAVRGEGDYLDWYCCGPYATISERVAVAMAGEGWTPMGAGE